MTGRLEVISGCMFAGKTEELIRRVEAVRAKGLWVTAFKPRMDSRYGSITQVISHAGRKLGAIPVDTEGFADLNVPTGTEVVGIDEAQFFPAALVDNVLRVLALGKRVILSGLDLNFKGQPFGIMPHLMALADEVTKFAAICKACGQPANRTQRLTEFAGDVLVGGSEVYEPRCLSCFRP